MKSLIYEGTRIGPTFVSFVWNGFRLKWDALFRLSSGLEKPSFLGQIDCFIFIQVVHSFEFGKRSESLNQEKKKLQVKLLNTFFPLFGAFNVLSYKEKNTSPGIEKY